MCSGISPHGAEETICGGGDRALCKTRTLLLSIALAPTRVNRVMAIYLNVFFLLVNPLKSYVKNYYTCHVFMSLIKNAFLGG